MPGLTLDELGARLPASPLTADEILAFWAACGIAEADADGCWRLTPAGEPLGAALLAMEPEKEAA